MGGGGGGGGGGGETGGHVPPQIFKGGHNIKCPPPPHEFNRGCMIIHGNEDPFFHLSSLPALCFLKVSFYFSERLVMYDGYPYSVSGKFTLVLVMVPVFLRTTGDDADAEIDELDVPAALVWVYSFLRTAGDNATLGVAEFVKSFTLVLVMVPVFLRTTGADGGRWRSWAYRAGLGNGQSCWFVLKPSWVPQKSHLEALIRMWV